MNYRLYIFVVFLTITTLMCQRLECFAYGYGAYGFAMNPTMMNPMMMNPMMMNPMMMNPMMMNPMMMMGGYSGYSAINQVGSASGSLNSFVNGNPSILSGSPVTQGCNPNGVCPTSTTYSVTGSTVGYNNYANSQAISTHSNSSATSTSPGTGNTSSSSSSAH